MLLLAAYISTPIIPKTRTGTCFIAGSVNTSTVNEIFFSLLSISDHGSAMAGVGELFDAWLITFNL
jgi:hypothetical protein